MLGIPKLESDVFIVLDCFIQELARLNDDDPRDIPFVCDDDNSWARYLIVAAGYAEPSSMPGKLSEKLISLLEELAISKRFYAREGLITSKILREKLEREAFDRSLNLCWFGNAGRDHIHLSPLQASVTA